MSLLVATPAYSGIVTLGYMNSCLELRKVLLEAGVKHNWLTTQNESLITRGRDCLAATFLKTDFEALMFIDADIEFKPEHVARLWNMDVPIAAGVYAMKRKDAPLSAWRNGKLVRLEDCPNEPFEVDYIGSGFLMIRREVFEKLKEAHPEWRYEDGGVKEAWAFFQAPVEDGILLSEDYFWSKRVRELGFKIMVDPSIRLTHWGAFPYGG